LSGGEYVSSLARRIRELSRARRAVILAHNYQLPEVQDIADFVGDSLQLARKAMEVDADVIVFAGVSFMAETAAALNPDKLVLHPNPASGCPLADYLTPQMVREYRRACPGAPVVVYVNSVIGAKAEADYVVTSSSAGKLISRLGVETVVFGPDKNLAEHAAAEAGVEVIKAPPYGHCPVHEYLLHAYYVRKALETHPKAKLIAHPETPREVRSMAFRVGSTAQMLKALGEVEGDEFILATEEGLTYRARKLYPGKRVYPANPQAICIDMKKITLHHILKALETLKPAVKLDPQVGRRAREVIEESLKLLK